MENHFQFLYAPCKHQYTVEITQCFYTAAVVYFFYCDDSIVIVVCMDAGQIKISFTISSQ